MADMKPTPWMRHDLIWIGGAPWAEILTTRPDIARYPLAVEWAERGRPLIVRRAAPGDAADGVPFGLPLPPAQGKARLAGTLPHSKIVWRGPPPRLADALDNAPLPWRDTVQRLLEVSAEVRTCGSLAWEHLTGLPYLSNTSDIDLLWKHNDGTTEARLRDIARIERDAPMQIDGEVINAAGAAVQWRELALGTSTVLAKHFDGAALISRAAFMRGELPC
jgi:phosphoribosyl-dephospho-CoA transferase